MERKNAYKKWMCGFDQTQSGVPLVVTIRCFGLFEIRWTLNGNHAMCDFVAYIKTCTGPPLVQGPPTEFLLSGVHCCGVNSCSECSFVYRPRIPYSGATVCMQPPDTFVFCFIINISLNES